MSLTLAAMVLAGLKYAIETRQLLRRRECVTRALKISWLILQHYSDVNGTLPSPILTDDAGHPLGSWRMTIWNYSGYPSTPRADLTHSWDSLVNRRVACCDDVFYCCGASRSTVVVAITGSGTAFDPAKRIALSHLEPDVVLAVEVRDSGIHWMQPGDLDLQDMPQCVNPSNRVGISGLDPSEFQVLFADYEVWRLRSDVPFQNLRSFFTIAGAKEFDREKLLGAYRLGRN